MSRQTSITCDQCGKTKGESNHWWRAFGVAVALKKRSLTEDTRYEYSLMFDKGNGVEAVNIAHPGAMMWDVCSEQCATILLGKWMRGELGK